jgi:hypothetical protein
MRVSCLLLREKAMLAAMARVLTVLFLAGSVLIGCSRLEEPRLAPLGRDEISAEPLWQRITEESVYADYAFWPGHEGERPGQSPHDRFHRIHINRTLREALPVAGRVAPPGAIIVKINLNWRGRSGRLAREAQDDRAGGLAREADDPRNLARIIGSALRQGDPLFTSRPR